MVPWAATVSEKRVWCLVVLAVVGIGMCRAKTVTAREGDSASVQPLAGHHFAVAQPSESLIPSPASRDREIAVTSPAPLFAGAGYQADGTRPAAPVITPGTGTYAAAQNVVITDSTAGASIYYTIDGSLPDVNANLYTGPIAVSASTMVRAVALIAGAAPSQTVTVVLNFMQMWPLVSFGDSVAAGHIGSPIDYPNQLALITGQPSLNHGIGGQSSGQIAVRMNAYAGTPKQTIASDLTIPTSGDVAIRFQPGYEACHRVVKGGSGFLMTIQSNPAVTGRCVDDGAGTLWFTPSMSPQNPIFVSAGTPWVAELGNELYQCVGIEEGRNNWADGQPVLDDIAATVAAVSSTTSCYFVLSVLNGDTPLEALGTSGYDQIASLNQSLSDSYGSHYIDWRANLVASNDPNNPDDQISLSHDALPYSLRAQSLSGTLLTDIADPSTCTFTLSNEVGQVAYVYVGDILLIDSEQILVEGGSNGSWQCGRGYAGTPATAHASGATYIPIDFVHPGQNATSTDNRYCSNGYICVAEQVYQWMQTHSPHTVSVATMISPASGSVLPGSTATFRWSAGMGVSVYVLYLGSKAGANDLFSSVSSNQLFATVSTIPTNGIPVYARLNSKINGFWQHLDYVYTEAGAPASMSTPTPSTVLSGSAVTFTWNPGAGVSAYSLNVGTTKAGSYDVYNSGVTTQLSAAVSNIPTYGMPVHVRLNSKIAGVWQYVDYVYTEAGSTAASMSTPTPSTVLSGSAVTFTWKPGGSVSAYSLSVGTKGKGSYDVYNSGATTQLSAAVSNIPTYGLPLYVRLNSKIAGTWQNIDYLYTEAGAPVPASMSTPTPSTVLSGSAVTFTWNPGGGVSAYSLSVGTKGKGSYDLYNSGAMTQLSAAVSNIPTLGGPVYVRLNSKVNGTWQSIDYLYTEAAAPAH
jgi:hypothetical protein